MEQIRAEALKTVTEKARTLPEMVASRIDIVPSSDSSAQYYELVLPTEVVIQLGVEPGN